MKDAGITNDKLLTFCLCGSNAWIQEALEGDTRYRVICEACKNRWCQPCGRQRAATVAANIAELTRGQDCRFITLTLRHSDTPLTLQLRHLYESFAKLRRVRPWKQTQTAGVAFLELKWTEKTQHWHPHLHVIAKGTFIDQSALKAAWWRITGDSFVVDVRRVSSHEHAARYVTKYATKVLNSSIYRNHDRLVEAMKALKGKRMIIPFGEWKRAALTTPRDHGEWRTLGTLASFLAKAKACDPEASRIIAQLRRTPECHPTNNRPPPAERTRPSGPPPSSYQGHRTAQTAAKDCTPQRSESGKGTYSASPAPA